MKSDRQKHVLLLTFLRNWVLSQQNCFVSWVYSDLYSLPRILRSQSAMAIASSWLLSFLCLHLTLTSQATAQSSLLRFSCDDDNVITANGTFPQNTADSDLSPFPKARQIPPSYSSPRTEFFNTYHEHLNALLSNLSSHTEIDYGFYNFSYGGQDTAYAIGLCRGDVKSDVCLKCLNDSSVLLIKNCPTSKKAIVWVDDCMLRYSDSNIFGFVDTSHSFTSCNKTSNKISNSEFNQELNDLLDKLKRGAASGDSRRKFARGNALSKYALAQCTPDLSEQDCIGCFDLAFPKFGQNCGGMDRGFAIAPSCNIRFDNYRFYADTPSPGSQLRASSPTLPPLPTRKGKSHKILAVILGIACVPVVLVLIIFIWLKVRKQRNPREYHQSELEADVDINANDSLKLDFESLKVATESFSDANKLGQGGSGIVYKGKLSDGQEVAIKKLFKTSRQEFKNEVPVGKLEHRNVVRLLGYCVERNERLLVYEHIPNKSLDDFIYDPIKRADLNWAKRYKIIVGIARGLLYLHEDSGQQTIHRDVKPSNILLDEEMNPKISDFGIAKWLEEDQTKGNTRNISGTSGYMAPEYEINGEYSTKSDVFSFGILILEIICGRKNIGIQNGEEVEDLPSLAWRNWNEKTPLNIVDSTINCSSRAEILRCIHIGLLCIQEVTIRPTMISIVEMLDGCTTTLPVPSDPVSEVTWTS